MKAPSYLHLYRAGIRALSDAVVLWHLAECGVNGSTTPQISDATGINYNSCHNILDRLQELRLTARPRRTHKQGTPNLWILSRFGYSLITGQAIKDESLTSIASAT